ncbi:serine O-acetyltransferase [Halorubrum trueperi]|uniref:Serine O-acetyltransferase n=1 Tax=Halorubrum trueperi TaxID=2004704 RepID=A0ABD5UL81_9EURY
MKPNQTNKWGWQLLSFIYYLRNDGLKTAVQETYRHLRYIFPLLPRKSDWMNFFRFKRLGMLTACDIERVLPKSTNIGHPTGIVIGQGVDIGKNVKIRQNVTIGKDPDREFPTIEDGVVIGAGAVILNDITVGENSTIGANSTVISDVPPDSVVVGSPAEIVNYRRDD